MFVREATLKLPHIFVLIRVWLWFHQKNRSCGFHLTNYCMVSHSSYCRAVVTTVLPYTLSYHAIRSAISKYFSEEHLLLKCHHLTPYLIQSPHIISSVKYLEGFMQWWTWPPTLSFPSSQTYVIVSLISGCCWNNHITPFELKRSKAGKFWVEILVHVIPVNRITSQCLMILGIKFA